MSTERLTPEADPEQHVLDRELAGTLASLVAVPEPLAELALLLASRQTRLGHVCVELERFAGRPLPGTLQAQGQRWPELEVWRSALGASDFVSDGSEPRPLVLDADNRLYLYRYWQHEKELAAQLRRRATTVDSPLSQGKLDGLLDRLFPTGHDAVQREAAAVALQQRFAVISGGPGTGKTTVLVRILAALQEQALASQAKPLRVLLLAPTGKAALRMSQAIRLHKDKLPCSEGARAAIPEEASTIHRALGVVWGSSTRFWHTAESPLSCDLVVVDEASMVDIALMRRLFEALPARARVVLLGDRYQLTSVEAGSVLGDMCSAASQGGPLSSCMVELERSYRFSAESGIGRFAACVRRGDAKAALAELAEDRADLVHVSSGAARGREAVVALACNRYLALTRQDVPEAALAQLERFCVLTAHRYGPSGVATINASVERGLGVSFRGSVGRDGVSGRSYLGRPVMIQQNAPELMLFNGDLGITHRGRGSSLRVFFAGVDGQCRSFSPGRLPLHETVYAMSIHKSQGSEFDEIGVVLPEDDSLLLTRELLYTAVTRARRQATIFASPDTITRAVERSVSRASGLAERLVESAPGREE